MQEDLGTWKDTRITVLGLAREGLALVRYLVAQGARVTASDMKGPDELRDALAALSGLPVRCYLGGHPPQVLDTNVLFVSPGIPLDAPILIEARRRGLRLSSESRLFSRLCPAPIVGVTGSSGKTTTCTLVSKMLEAGTKRVHLGGNIGSPLLDRLGQIEPTDVVVAELSSFQLDFFGPTLDAEPRADLGGVLFPPGGWSPPVAVVLNVTPNHLDRHPSMQSYAAAKAKILRFQRPQDVAVLNWDDPVTRGFSTQCPGRVRFFSLREPVPEGAYLSEGRLWLSRKEGDDVPICAAGDVRLRGRHNVANVLAACTASAVLGISAQDMARVARDFAGVEHRLEPVREWRGVWYYNDSIATTPERAIAALNAFSEPIVLLAGGRDKHLPWEDWARLVAAKAVQVIAFGEAAPLIEKVLADLGHSGPPVRHASSLAEAVQFAGALARPGQVVLFAPGGTSFDAFRDYEERGRTFKALVNFLG